MHIHKMILKRVRAESRSVKIILKMNKAHVEGNEVTLIMNTSRSPLLYSRDLAFFTN